MTTLISRDELQRKMARHDPFILVEALPAMAYDHAHLPGAVNLPPGEAAARAPQLLPDKNAEIVLYCGSAT